MMSRPKEHPHIGSRISDAAKRCKANSPGASRQARGLGIAIRAPRWMPGISG